MIVNVDCAGGTRRWGVAAAGFFVELTRLRRKVLRRAHASTASPRVLMSTAGASASAHPGE